MLRESSKAAPESAFQRDAIEARLRQSIQDPAITAFDSMPLGDGPARRVRWRGLVNAEYWQGVEYLRNVGSRHLRLECSSTNREKMLLAYESFDMMAASLQFIP